MRVHKIFPFLNGNNKIQYVDADLNSISNTEYKRATLFTATGYASVTNDSFQSAIIDIHGNEIISFGNYDLDLAVVNGLTLFRKNTEYSTSKRFWNWSYDLFSGLNKTVRRSKIEIGVIETGQKLFSKRMMTSASNKHYLSPVSLDDSYFLLNQTLYRVDDLKIKRIHKNIVRVLHQERLLKAGKAYYSIITFAGSYIGPKKLEPVNNWNFTLFSELITLENLNTEAGYKSQTPKLLKDIRSGEIYVYPYFDKTLPNQVFIRNDAADTHQLKKVSLIVSIPDTPYFILGGYNSEHRRYQWLYMDNSGNMLPEIPVKNFYITSQTGDVFWPAKESIFSSNFLPPGWKLKTLIKTHADHQIFIASIQKDKEKKYGIWNSALQEWMLVPAYKNISVLDAEQHLYALTDLNSSLYQIYDLKNNRAVSNNFYHSISANGYASRKSDDGHFIYFFVDIYSGREYTEYFFNK